MTTTRHLDHITEDLAPVKPPPQPAPPLPVRFIQPRADSWAIHGWAGLRDAAIALLALLILFLIAGFFLGAVVIGRVH